MLRKTSLVTSFLVASILSGTLSYADTEKAFADSIISPTGEGTSATKKQSSGRGEAIIVMKKGISASSAESILSQAGMKINKSYAALSSLGKKTSYMLVTGGASTENLVSELKKNPNIKLVSPNYRRAINIVPNDPKFGDLWGLENTGQDVNGIIGTTGADIKAPTAWDTDTDTSDAVVAVFDTGVFYKHEDLIDSMWVNQAEVANDGVDNDGNGYIDDVYGYDFAAELNGANDSDPLDIDSHGTHVAGTIGAKGNNNVGIVGVGWNTKIMALKVARPNLGFYDSDILEAINYVLLMKRSGVNIVAINASYGGNGGHQTDPMNAAIKSLGNEGIMFIAAAGNSGAKDPSNFPSSYDAENIISVAATDQNDELANFSNYGLIGADIAAPGANILSSVPGPSSVVATILDDDIESGGANWTASDTWAITAEDAKSATKAWSDSPGGEYANKLNSSLSSAADIDLSAFIGQDIGLGMCLKYDIEKGWDYLYIEVSGDSGTNWNTLKAITGKETNWNCDAFVIPENVKTASFRMRLRLKTDQVVTADGVYVDNIAIGAITSLSAYNYFNGTSMATPHVTGSIPLIAKLFPSESMLYRVNRVLTGATTLAPLSEKVASGGRLNLEDSIKSDLVYRPMILEIDKTEGLLKDNIISMEGIEFGSTAGKVFFSNNLGTKVEGEVTEWSTTKVGAKVPEHAGKYISIETSEPKAALNSVKGSAWDFVSPMEGSRTFSTGVSYKGRIYMFGGLGPVADASTEIYDPATDSWSRGAPMPTSRYYATATVLNDKIYVISGIDGTRRPTDIIEVYDPIADSWAAAGTIAPLPKKLFAAKAVATNDKLYVVGGAEFAPRRVILPTLFEYDSANNTWIQKADMTVPRLTHEAVAYAGKIYAFGGHQGGGIVHKITEEYNPTDDTWTTVAEMPTTLWFLSATATSKGITVAGGDMDHHNDSDRVMYFDPAANSWSEEEGSMKELIAPRVASSMVHLLNKGYYIVGGGRRQRLDSVVFLADNNAPVAGDDTATISENSPVIIDVLVNDTDGDGDTPALVSVTTPSHGTATINGSSITYKPSTNFDGTDSFSYTVTDTGGAHAQATVTITVTNINRPPVAVDDTVTLNEGSSIDIDVLDNDNDEDGALIIRSVSTPSHGTATITTGKVTYTPNTDYDGTDSFSYIVNDNSGASANATVSITVINVNKLPVTTDDTATLNEDDSIDIDVLANDSDPDGTMTISSVTNPINGTATINGEKVTYTPNSHYNGTDSFSYTVKDNDEATSSATVSITVTSTNKTPVAKDDSVSLKENKTIIISILDNDSDPDGGTLKISSVTTPAHGTATINGTKITYKPTTDYHGPDSFSYTIKDSDNATASAKVVIVVKPVKDDEGTGSFDGIMLFLMLAFALYSPIRHRYLKK